MDDTDLRTEANKLELQAGDMLVDELIGTIGILMEPEEDPHIAGYYYKSKFWKVYWVSTNDEFHAFTGTTYVEEYGLKMSIAIGIYIHHSISGNNKQEKI